MKKIGLSGDSAVKKWLVYGFLFATWCLLAGHWFPYSLAIPLGVRFFVYMLQLSSYQLPGYFRFLNKNTLRHSAWWVIAAVLMFYCHNTVVDFYDGSAAFSDVGYVTWIPWILFAIILTVKYIPRKRKEKKKFVVTPRIRRLYVTVALIFLFFRLLLWIVPRIGWDIATNYYTQWFLLSLPVLLPFTVALAALINSPWEKAINQSFIDDAVRILKDQPRLRILGVTGSYGKTSVKYYLTTILSEQFDVLMTPESYNTPMGIVRTIREQMKPTHELFVCEMGARHVGDIKEITDFVHPDDGVLTAIGEQHMETFFTQENIVKTKYELMDAVEEKHPAAGRRKDPSASLGVTKKEGSGTDGGLKFVNGDNEVIRANMKYPDAITYGLEEGNDFRAIDLKVTGTGTTFKIQLSKRMAKRLAEEQGYAENGPFDKLRDRADETNVMTGEDTPTPVDVRGAAGTEFHTVLVGAHNIQNITGAIAVATLYGMPSSKIKMGVRRIEPVPHRLELKKHGNVTILNDAFNSNPAGAKAALDTLAMFENAVKILVTPGMVELGEREDALNEAFGAQAAAVCDYILLVGEKQTAAVKKGVLEAGFPEEKLFVEGSFNDASVLMYELEPSSEKVILLENDLPDNY